MTNREYFLMLRDAKRAKHLAHKLRRDLQSLFTPKASRDAA